MAKDRVRNRWAGPCEACGEVVEASEGIRQLRGIADQRHWVTVHLECQNVPTMRVKR